MNLFRSTVTFYASRLCWVLTATVLALSADLAQATAARAAQDTADILPGYIVVFRGNINVDSSSRSLAETYGLHVQMLYRHALKGMAAYIPPGLLKRLEQDPRVAYIEPVQAMHLHAQTLPTGIDRINVELNATANIDNIDDGIDVDIAIIDTGVDIDHPDLNVYRYVYCYPKNPNSGTCDENDIRADDSNGHGTHVAGIAAARDNNTGVVGVAPGARIWGIRVSQENGSITSREVIAAIDYVAANASQIEVANMSLGFVGTLAALDQAITNTVAAGVTIVVSAGNEAVDVSQVSPAGHPDVITVSALADFDGEPGGLLNQNFTYTGPDPDCTENQDDSFACFSNYGSGVDIMAPGTKIKSTYLNGGTATLHGTSMASPHVAGAAAIYLANHPGASPATVKAALIASGDATPCNTLSGYCTDDPDNIFEPMILLAPFPEPDADGDGIPDEQDNCPMDANPAQTDTDSDGDGNACDPDDDNDGLSDIQENALGTDPLLTDTDIDGLSDAAEVTTYYTDPLNNDSDFDGLIDGLEVNTHGTDPLSADTDSDGLDDGTEVTYGSDPLDENSWPNIADGDLAPWNDPDAQINAADTLIAVQLVLGQRTAGPLQYAHGDMNNNSMIDITDLLLIQQTALQ